MARVREQTVCGVASSAPLSERPPGRRTVDHTPSWGPRGGGDDDEEEEEEEFIQNRTRARGGIN